MRIPAGRQELEITFRSHAFMIGLPITFLTAITMVLVWLAEGSRHGGLVASLAMPLARDHFSACLDVTMRSR